MLVDDFCHCTGGHRCHGDVSIEAFKCEFLGAHDRDIGSIGPPAAAELDLTATTARLWIPSRRGRVGQVRPHVARVVRRSNRLPLLGEGS